MTTQTKEEAKTQIYTTVFTQLMGAWKGGKRRFFVEGGTSSSKTYSIMQFLKLLLENYKEPILATVSSESLPHMKRGVIKDFLTIMGDELISSCWNRSDYVYTFPKSGCKLEFVSDDQPEKWTGGRREIQFWNELNNIHKMSYREGDLRTLLFTIGDWNPYSEFWFHDDKLGKEEENVFIQGLTYHDTPEVVSDSVIRTVESYKDKDPNYYRVHGLGLMGKIEGLVYPNFEQVDELPPGAYFYGLDFGYLVDPTVLVKNVILGDKLFSQQIFYDTTGLDNTQIARKMTLCGVGREPIYPDPDEPKSADELRKLGFNVQEAVKGKGSVEFGMQRVNQFYQHWTRDSLECIKDQRNFRFITDRQTGEFTERTTHEWSHGPDARRYGVASYRQGAGNPYPSGTSKRRLIDTRPRVSYPSSFRR